MIIENGHKVSVHYTGTFDNGEVFDSSKDRGPLDFEVGAGQMIKGFDDAVVGMTTGESKQITLEPEDAYGHHNKEMVIDMAKKNFPEDMEVTEGMQLQLSNPQGQPIMATVVSIGEDAVTLDANHPMAGKTLNFDLEIVEVK